MPLIPTSLLNSLTNLKGFNKEAFEKVHASGQQVVSVRFNPEKFEPDQLDNYFSPATGDNITLAHSADVRVSSKVPWSSYGYYLSARPSFTFDPLLHAGVYYVQEASSMFLEQAFTQSVQKNTPLKVLDLCAAPGGKSTLLQSLITGDSLLVSNEVIKTRAAVLEENLTKWGGANVVVTNNDPAHFARLKNYFDVMVIDAPCSGSGLFRRDPSAINEWSENNVQLCSQRQQRIIADAWPALKKDGVLIYCTCSYSPAEDEDILDWLFDNFSVESIRLQVEHDWNIVETESAVHHGYGYRFYPDRIAGEGFFIAVLRKKDGDAYEPAKASKNKSEKLSKEIIAIASEWLQNNLPFAFFSQQQGVVAIAASLASEIPVLQSALYIKKAGVAMGRIAGKELIPDHALALSSIIRHDLPAIDFTLHQSLQYLRRADIQIATHYTKGWLLAKYAKKNLGWVKVLPNRINNYYPKEWRILKDPSSE